MSDAVNEWVVYAANAGIIDRSHSYWVLGKGAASDTPRWSILRNVLGWTPDRTRRR